MINPITFYKDFMDKITGVLSRRTTAIDMDTHIADATYVSVDTELTGLVPRKDSIISIGAVKMWGGRIDLGNAFYRLINPSTSITSDSVVIHEITPSDVEGLPALDSILSEFIGFCGNSILVGHFISIDIEFINKELNRTRGTQINNMAIDTYRIHEWMKVNAGDFGRHYRGYDDDLDLFSLARRYRVSFSGGHNALNDAFIAAQLFQRFLSHLPKLGVRTLRDLLIIGKH
jgi:DNA polymerase-3 subunit epsilon